MLCTLCKCCCTSLDLLSALGSNTDRTPTAHRPCNDVKWCSMQCMVHTSYAVQVMRSKLGLINTALVSQPCTTNALHCERSVSIQSAMQLRCHSMFASSRAQLAAYKQQLRRLERFIRFSATRADVQWAGSGWSTLNFVSCMHNKPRHSIIEWGVHTILHSCVRLRL